MIIDDSRAMRMILRRIMAAAGFEATEAGDGHEALSSLEIATDVPDIALIDWNMPNMNGLEFVKAIRPVQRYSHMTLMMVTSEGEQAQIVRALAAGAHEYLVKPFTPEAILQKLQLLGLTSVGARS
jgi:two-component system chemotaxis response regulator CheY